MPAVCKVTEQGLSSRAYLPNPLEIGVEIGNPKSEGIDQVVGFWNHIK